MTLRTPELLAPAGSLSMLETAMIMSDPGLTMRVRDTWPDMEIHLSVQANTVDSAAVKLRKSVGVARVILSRALSLGQVAQVRQECPDTEHFSARSPLRSPHLSLVRPASSSRTFTPQ
jgi:collagenase-like PrtC family protease